MHDLQKKDVVIIGAGASGLMCAIECGKRGRSVLVLDHADRICSKVLISGGGRCNFTNLNVTADHYLSDNPHFCRSALARFGTRDMLVLLQKHHIPYYEKEAGQLFCARSSRDIVAMLKNECDRSGVEIRLNSRITTVNKKDAFHVTTGQGRYAAESLVVATGGLSYRKLGASGFGHTLARQFGLSVIPLRPALVPFTFSQHDLNAFRSLAGISLSAVVRCGRKKFRGNILFTHRGLSGPAALQASSYWKRGEPVVIDLLPETDLAALFDQERQGKMEMRTLLARCFPKRFAETWCALYSLTGRVHGYSDKELRSIEAGLRAWEITPGRTEGYDAAEVTAGGVDTAGISSKTMESRDVPGLYFLGEVLDVTGHLGGYNLHWAWASGFAAGQYA